MLRAVRAAGGAVWDGLAIQIGLLGGDRGGDVHGGAKDLQQLLVQAAAVLPAAAGHLPILLLLLLILLLLLLPPGVGAGRPGVVLVVEGRRRGRPVRRRRAGVGVGLAGRCLAGLLLGMVDPAWRRVAQVRGADAAAVCRPARRRRRRRRRRGGGGAGRVVLGVVVVMVLLHEGGPDVPVPRVAPAWSPPRRGPWAVGLIVVWKRVLEVGFYKIISVGIPTYAAA